MRAPISDPAGAGLDLDHGKSPSVAFRQADAVGPRDSSFEALFRSSHAPCVRFAPPVARRRATLGSAGWSALGGRDLHPRGRFDGFDVYFIFLHPRLGLAPAVSRQPGWEVFGSVPERDSWLLERCRAARDPSLVLRASEAGRATSPAFELLADR